jgi:hypothetical protein
MMNRGTPSADTRAAPAALARLSLPEIVVDRILLIDDTDEDITQILTVIFERTFPEVQS